MWFDFSAHGKPGRVIAAARTSAVLFDRDGTLVDDVPYNGDPDLVTPRPGARSALDLLRGKGIRLGIVSNQSGVGRGLLTEDDVRRIALALPQAEEHDHHEAHGPRDVLAVGGGA